MPRGNRSVVVTPRNSRSPCVVYFASGTAPMEAGVIPVHVPSPFKKLPRLATGVVGTRPRSPVSVGDAPVNVRPTGAWLRTVPETNCVVTRPAMSRAARRMNGEGWELAFYPQRV